MLKNRPVDISEVTFNKLINNSSLPIVQFMCRMNSVNRTKQKFGNWMGLVNLGIVRMRLHSTKENNEDPTKFEMFIATHTSSKGKEVDSKAKAAINFKIAKMLEKLMRMHSKQCLGRSSLVGFDAM